MKEKMRKKLLKPKVIKKIKHKPIINMMDSDSESESESESDEEESDSNSDEEVDDEEYKNMANLLSGGI
jgi:hypothetical protein